MMWQRNMKMVSGVPTRKRRQCENEHVCHGYYYAPERKCMRMEPPDKADGFHYSILFSFQIKVVLAHNTQI